MIRFSIVVLFVFMSITFNAVADKLTYDVEKIGYKNLVANIYLPRVQSKVPAVIAFGGSEGGLVAGNANGEMLAPHGIAVLALAFFNEKGLPSTLDQIPLEYFVKAIDYLSAHPSVDASRIGIVGGSRGSEAVFLVSSIDDRIKSVVATTPSNVAWYGLTKPVSAWMLNGKEIPAMSLALDSEAKLLDRFLVALKDVDRVKELTFNFENINGPIFMVSAIDDEIWPSYKMAKDIEVYLEKKNFKHSVVHDSYETGHSFSPETAPEIKRSIVDHFLKTL